MASTKEEKIDYKQLQDLLAEVKTLAYTKKAVDSHNEDAPKSLAEKFEKLLWIVDKSLTGENGNISTTKCSLKLLSIKGAIYYEQAKIWNSLKMEGAQKLLETGIAIVQDKKDEPIISYMYIRLINHLSFLLLNQGEFEKAKNILETVTDNYEKKGDTVVVYTTEELFSDIEPKLDNERFTKIIIHNYQLLAWLYGKLGFPSIQADKQHVALEKQLEIDACDPIIWSCSCMRLANLYLFLNRWNQARYHLQAATETLDQFERSLIEHPELARAQAELAREWVSYGLHLFSTSRTMLVEKKYPEIFKNKVSCIQSEDNEHVAPFSDLEVTVSNTPINLVVSTEDARNLFIYTYSWLKRARLYYTLRDYPIHYVNGVLDLSELYRYLAYYENDLDLQYDVHKRRSDALENLCAVLKEVRPQCYIAVNVELFREMAEIQLEMMGLNLRRIRRNNDENEDEDTIKRKIAATSDIHAKLVSMGNFLEQNKGVEKNEE